MRLTQEVIQKIQLAMTHTKMNGETNWKDGDDECFLRVLEPISSNLHPDKPVSSFLSMSFII